MFLSLVCYNSTINYPFDMRKYPKSILLCAASIPPEPPEGFVTISIGKNMVTVVIRAELKCFLRILDLGVLQPLTNPQAHYSQD